MDHERVTMSWSDVGVAVDDLARQVVDDGYEPDLVLTVARGGMAVGMALGYALDVKASFTLNVELYTGVDERLEAPVLVAPVPSPLDLDGRRVLVVDDIADTGLTLRHVLDFCAGHVADARTAVVFEKQRSVVLPDYSWRRVDAWVDFPWSVRPPVRRRVRA